MIRYRNEMNDAMNVIDVMSEIDDLRTLCLHRGEAQAQVVRCYPHACYPR